MFYLNNFTLFVPSKLVYKAPGGEGPKAKAKEQEGKEGEDLLVKQGYENLKIRADQYKRLQDDLSKAITANNHVQALSILNANNLIDPDVFSIASTYFDRTKTLKSTLPNLNDRTKISSKLTTFSFTIITRTDQLSLLLRHTKPNVEQMKKILRMYKTLQREIKTEALVKSDAEDSLKVQAYFNEQAEKDTYDMVLVDFASDYPKFDDEGSPGYDKDMVKSVKGMIKSEISAFFAGGSANLAAFIKSLPDLVKQEAPLEKLITIPAFQKILDKIKNSKEEGAYLNKFKKGATRPKTGGVNTPPLTPRKPGESPQEAKARRAISGLFGQFEGRVPKPKGKGNAKGGPNAGAKGAGDKVKLTGGAGDKAKLAGAAADKAKGGANKPQTLPAGAKGGLTKGTGNLGTTPPGRAAGLEGGGKGAGLEGGGTEGGGEVQFAPKNLDALKIFLSNKGNLETIITGDVYQAANILKTFNLSHCKYINTELRKLTGGDDRAEAIKKAAANLFRNEMTRVVNLEAEEEGVTVAELKLIKADYVDTLDDSIELQNLDKVYQGFNSYGGHTGIPENFDLTTMGDWEVADEGALDLYGTDDLGLVEYDEDGNPIAPAEYDEDGNLITPTEGTTGTDFVSF
ncbi:hypothetical protein ACFL3T_02825 [Patescibacteria group bacterium]